MKLLLDTNVLVALLDPDSAEHGVVISAARRLSAAGVHYWLAPQVLIEFWAVATRPRSGNGLGWPSARVHQEVERLFQTSLLLEETSRLFPVWLQLVARHRVAGKRVHDARLAATMLVYGITHILTFDVKGFPSSWGITAVAPASL